ncbi:MAG: ribonuclease HIII [Planctomycetota bacterium]
MSSTVVLSVSRVEAAALKEELRRKLPIDAEWRRVDHALFAVKADGVVLVCYESGKLVLQGKGIDSFRARYLAGIGSEPDPPEPRIAFDGPTIGSDEAGKGDYFGPLVVAAVFAGLDRAAELEAMGVSDSKRLSDARMMPMAEHIEREFDVEIRELDPPAYNARYRADPNVNHLLADLHAEALVALLARHPEASVVVDRFGREELVASRLRGRGATPRRLLQVPRAEAHPVVAAASVVARVRFLEGMRRCSDECGVELHKGAGSPVDAVAREVFAVGGAGLMSRVAKLHFRNSERVPGFRKRED